MKTIQSLLIATALLTLASCATKKDSTCSSCSSCDKDKKAAEKAKAQ